MSFALKAESQAKASISFSQCHPHPANTSQTTLLTIFNSATSDWSRGAAQISVETASARPESSSLGTTEVFAALKLLSLKVPDLHSKLQRLPHLGKKRPLEALGHRDKHGCPSVSQVCPQQFPALSPRGLDPLPQHTL